MKLKKTKMLSVVLALLLSCIGIPFTAFANSDMNESTSEDLIQEISYAKDGDTIYIDGTVVIDKVITVDKDITLAGKNNARLIRAKGYQDKMVNIKANVSMNDLSISGENEIVDACAICVSEGAVFNMNSGSICYNKTYFSGAGIYNKGTVNIYGGIICNNTARLDGAGVYNRGTLNMFGGEIDFNKAGNSGGGVYTNKLFNLSGGKIYNNTASQLGGGVINTRETGYSSTQPQINISGGEISCNTAETYGGGICSTCGKIEISEGKIYKNIALYGGNLIMNTTLNISGGEITSNEAALGGGLCCMVVDCTMDGGIISNNKAMYGAGISNTNSYFTMTGGEISFNESTNAKQPIGMGGGMFNSSSILEMQGGKIVNNTADLFAGGVYNDAKSKCIKSGNAAIEGNSPADIYDVPPFDGSDFEVNNMISQIKSLSENIELPIA